MQRNTATTLGNLRIGDRFSFPGKLEVWQVVAPIGKGKVAINQFNDQGERVHPYDDIKKESTPVRFLRHTVLEFGEDGLIEQLKPGDVFTIGTDIIKEYVVLEQFKYQATPKGECKAVKLDGSKDFVFIPHGTEISFLRKIDNNGSKK